MMASPWLLRGSRLAASEPRSCGVERDTLAVLFNPQDPVVDVVMDLDSAKGRGEVGVERVDRIDPREPELTSAFHPLGGCRRWAVVSRMMWKMGRQGGSACSVVWKTWEGL